MGVAAHLGISLRTYDERIRSFIPDYEEMLQAAAAVIPSNTLTILDLGIGTGALSGRCLRTAPQAHIIGVDSDAGILDIARQRLGGRAKLVHGSFSRIQLPECDAAVASFALHHVRTWRAKEKLYRSIRSALRSRGVMINVDCQPAHDRALARQQMQAWRSHLMNSYSSTQAVKFLRDWAREDVYLSLEKEIELITRAGFHVEIVWRRGAFAILAAKSLT